MPIQRFTGRREDEKGFWGGNQKILWSSLLLTFLFNPLSVSKVDASF
jgi:hypothetical protein